MFPRFCRARCPLLRCSCLRENLGKNGCDKLVPLDAQKLLMASALNVRISLRCRRPGWPAHVRGLAIAGFMADLASMSRERTAIYSLSSCSRSRVCSQVCGSSEQPRECKASRCWFYCPTLNQSSLEFLRCGWLHFVRNRQHQFCLLHRGLPLCRWKLV